MAKPKKEKDVIARLADRGEDVLQKLSELPGGGKVLKAFNELRERVDDLAKRVRGLDELERRIAALEQHIASQKPDTRTRAATPAKPKPAPRKPAA